MLAINTPLYLQFQCSLRPRKFAKFRDIIATLPRGLSRRFLFLDEMDVSAQTRKQALKLLATFEKCVRIVRFC